VPIFKGLRKYAVLDGQISALSFTGEARCRNTRKECQASAIQVYDLRIASRQGVQANLAQYWGAQRK